MDQSFLLFVGIALALFAAGLAALLVLLLIQRRWRREYGRARRDFLSLMTTHGSRSRGARTGSMTKK